MTPQARNRNGPDTQEGGSGQIFARTDPDSPSQPERTPQLASSNIPHPCDTVQSGPVVGRALDGTGVLLYDSGWHPGTYIAAARIVAIETPTKGPQGSIVDDVLRGKWILPPENSHLDLDLDAGGVRVPVTRPSPNLEGGAAVPIGEENQKLALALVG